MSDASPTAPPPMPGCGVCNAVLNPYERFCRKCGTQMAGSAMAPSPPLPPIPVVAQPASFVMKLLSVLLVLGALLISWVISAARYKEISGEQFGYAFGFTLVPFLIAFFVSRRKKTVHGARTFSMVFSAIFLFVLITNFAGNSSPSPAVPLNELIRNSVREAAGGKPSGPTGTLKQQRVAALVRDMTRDLMEARKQHDLDAQPYIDTLARRFSVHSFSGRTAMEEMRDAVDGMHKIDLRFADAFRAMPQTAKKRVDASDLNSQDKESFLEGFNKSFADSEMTKAWESRWQADDQWSGSVHDLYEFTLKHSSQIKTTKEKVVITGHGTLEEFNSRLAKCRELDRQMIAAQKKVMALQQANMKSLGLTNQDLGIKP
jgi:hypothetical protein